jgi:hypothetical protein
MIDDLSRLNAAVVLILTVRGGNTRVRRGRPHTPCTHSRVRVEECTTVNANSADSWTRMAPLIPRVIWHLL